MVNTTPLHKSYVNTLVFASSAHAHYNNTASLRVQEITTLIEGRRPELNAVNYLHPQRCSNYISTLPRVGHRIYFNLPNSGYNPRKSLLGVQVKVYLHRSKK